MSAIEWTEKTWNPIVGCSIVSPGCAGCYAMRQAARLLDGNPKTPHYAGTTQPSKAGPVWTGKVALAPEHVLAEPLRRQKPTTWFVNSMGDLFHEDVPDEWIDRVFAVMALCPQHTFQVLTKRSARMRAYLTELNDSGRWLSWRHPTLGHEIFCPYGARFDVMFKGVWLGVSAERQQEADARILDLLATPAAVRFVSAEPLLGPIFFTHLTDGPAPMRVNALTGEAWEWHGAKSPRDPWDWHGAKLSRDPWPALDWIIVGGESGPGARPMHPDWARSIRDQCQAAGTPFFFKQWGEWAWSDDGVTYTDAATSWGSARFPHGTHLEHHSCGRTAFRVGKSRSGRLLDGREWNEMPGAQRAEVA